MSKGKQTQVIPQSKPRPKRSYCFEAILYPDDPKCSYYLMNLRKLIERENLDWSCVLHDRDIKEDGSGSLKEPHLHFLVRYHNPVTLPRLSLDTCIPQQYVQMKAHLQSAVRYHVHLDHPDKAQYNPLEVFGTLGHWLVREAPSESDGSSYRYTDDLCNAIEIAEAIGLAGGSAADMLRSLACAQLLKAYKDFSASVMAVYRESKEQFHFGRRAEEWEAERKQMLEQKQLLQDLQCMLDKETRRSAYGHDC